jgi:hypothetical protein
MNRSHRSPTARRATAAGADPDAPDDPAAAAYPLLYNSNAATNDYMLREIVKLFRNRGQGARFTPFDRWTLEDPSPVNQSRSTAGVSILLNISDHPLEFVGGMLFAGGTSFLFNESPFIERRLRDVRCRFGYTTDGSTNIDLDITSGVDGDDAANAREHSTVSGADARDGADSVGPTSPPPGAVDASAAEASAADAEASDAASPTSPRGIGVRAAPAVKYQYDSQRQRVYFQLREYQGASERNGWIVQSLQLIGRHGCYGKVFYRAFNLRDRPPEVWESLASFEATRPTGDATVSAARMPVPGEDELRKSNPQLYDWCLRRDPIEMGAAAHVIANVTSYFKFSFTVMRTVKALLYSIRVMQRFARQFLRNKRAAEGAMIAKWHALEVEFRDRLRQHRPLPGDEIDVVVNSILVERAVTTQDFKRGVIRKQWDTDKRRYLRNAQFSKGTNFAFAGFRWAMEAQALMALSQRELLDQCSSGPASCFEHPVVKAMFAVQPPTDKEVAVEMVRQAARADPSRTRRTASPSPRRAQESERTDSIVSPSKTRSVSPSKTRSVSRPKKPRRMVMHIGTDCVSASTAQQLDDRLKL